MDEADPVVLQVVDDGGPAFPLGEQRDGSERFVVDPESGMSLRSYFAAHVSWGDMAPMLCDIAGRPDEWRAKALLGVTDPDAIFDFQKHWPRAVAIARFIVADEMLARRALLA